jgi:hypothetical protein
VVTVRHALDDPDRAEMLDALEIVRDWLMYPDHHHGVPVSQIRTLVRWLKVTG